MLGDKLLAPPHDLADFNVTGKGGLAELEAWCTKDKTGDLFSRCALRYHVIYDHDTTNTLALI